MGTWSAKPFGNDSAMDWLGELTSTNKRTVLIRPLKKVLSRKGVPDSPECEEAVAASALIHAACKTRPAGLPEEAKNWVTSQGFVPDKELIALTISALERIAQNSELLQLWMEAGTGKRRLNSLSLLARGLREAKRKPLVVRTARRPAAPKLLARLIESVSPADDGKRRSEVQARLDALEDVNAPLPGTVRASPLCVVAAQGLVPEASKLLARGADPNYESGMGYGPLVYAASANHPEMITLLLQNGAVLNKVLIRNRDTGGPTSSGDNNTFSYAYTPGLFTAATRGSVPTLGAFLAAGADLRQVDLNGETLLHKAAEGQNPVPSIEYLLQQGLDINARKNLAETPLHYAVRAGNMPAIQCLLAHGADVNVVGEIDGTPLDMLRRPSNAIGRLLRQHGAKLASELRS